MKFASARVCDDKFDLHITGNSLLYFNNYFKINFNIVSIY
jgi:hypothetical protein